MEDNSVTKVRKKFKARHAGSTQNILIEERPIFKRIGRNPAVQPLLPTVFWIKVFRVGNRGAACVDLMHQNYLNHLYHSSPCPSLPTTFISHFQLQVWSVKTSVSPLTLRRRVKENWGMWCMNMEIIITPWLRGQLYNVSSSYLVISHY